MNIILTLTNYNMTNFKQERTKSLQDLLRDKTTILEYMKVTAANMWIDINKPRRTNEYRNKTIQHLILPIDFPSLIYKLLDMVDLYITVKKYSNEEIIPTEEERVLLTTIQHYLEQTSVWKESQWLLDDNNN